MTWLIIALLVVLGIILSTNKSHGEPIKIEDNINNQVMVKTNSPAILSEKPTKEDIERYIRQVAREHGVDENMFVAVAKCESGFNPLAHGDGHLGGSYGIWQIHKPAHPDVSYEEATDIEFSTLWAVEKWKINPKIWTCYRLLKI